MASKERACTVKRYDVTEADLPLSCPMPRMRVWDAHPRVYLPVAESGHAKCPYCEAEYFLKQPRKGAAHVESA